MVKKIVKALLGGFVLLAVLGVVVFVATGPKQPPASSLSAQWLKSGPYPVASTDFIWVDQTRVTDPNRGNPGKPERTLPVTIWYPIEAEGAHPLIIHSHGIVSARNELTYLMESLASHGYVVVAADYPLTSGSTPGGANGNDVVNQPADVSFLIDSVLSLGQAQPFSGEIDTTRIGLTGFSLGGLTTSLATYHPRWRDPRISAAVAIAGPSLAFTSKFYESSDAPFLMISGTADALIDTEWNGLIIPERNPGSALVTIQGGTHLGFVAMAEPSFRFMHNPDSLGCSAVLAVLDEDPNEVFARLGTEEEGIQMPIDAPGVCDIMPLREASHPGRQHMITQLAVLSFFESVFSRDQTIRQEATSVLEVALTEDFEEVTFIKADD